MMNKNSLIMQLVRRVASAIAAVIVLAGPIPYALAQQLPTPEQLAADLRYANDILAKLANSDVTSIEHGLRNDFIVLTVLRTIREKAAEDHRCLLTVQSKYWGYFNYSIYVLQKRLGPREDVYSHMVVHGQAEEFVGGYGCNSPQVQSSLENGIGYALGGQNPAPYELEEEAVLTVGFPFIDHYCSVPGRYDPACSKLIGFIMGRPTASCFGGLSIPAAPAPPKVVRCVYVMPISEETRRGFGNRHTYWYQRVPSELDSLRVYGLDQFSSIAPVAVEACPKSFKEAARISGDRSGFPISARPGEATGIPDPPPPLRVPHCEDSRVTQPTEIAQDFEEGDYELLQGFKPVYPARALSRGIQGQVEVSFTISTIGAVTDPLVVSTTTSLFNRAAINAVKKYRYKPRVVDGQAVQVTGVTETVIFKIEE